MFDIFNTEQNPSSAPAAFASDIYVISVGGSLIFNESSPDADKIKAIAETISQLNYSGKKFVIVVGGGKSAREYVGAARSLGLNNFEQDLLGIDLTRANAALVAAALPNAYKAVMTDVRKAREIIDSGKIPVFGGLMPLFTTDTVGALLAEYLNATFVNLTNVAGVYDSDPNENPEAQLLPEISYSKLISLIADAESAPGQHVVLDLPCCMILQRSKIPAVVMNGNDLVNFAAFVRGEQYKGTMIREIYGEEEQSVAEEEVSEETDIEKPKRKRKVVRKKPAPRKGNYSPPNPYQIDF